MLPLSSYLATIYCGTKNHFVALLPCEYYCTVNCQSLVLEVGARNTEMFLLQPDKCSLKRENSRHGRMRGIRHVPYSTLRLLLTSSKLFFTFTIFSYLLTRPDREEITCITTVAHLTECALSLCQASTRDF